ncbi:hypothetical protein [Acinetobacter sp. ANC 4648]|uniref:hypothetical protein n=1 Tax=Acinetobacter sp. ANC 4648 TaxID=1977875 RepID=UPI000A333011|nr:hypothetical protein [Acinetobacter sp. ANC 4648]OTG81620.1 hypothetical protein B9T27_10110 [Acinetobacter sp. ANC 4648]
MKTKTYLYLSMGILLNQTAMAESFIETFQGAPKLNVNLYVFAADVNGSISQGNINYDVDQPFKETIKELDSSFMAHADLSKGKWGLFADKQIVKTAQNKNAMNLPIALNTKLDQSSYGIYYQAYISPYVTSKSQPKLIIEPTIGVHNTKAEATLGVLNKTAKIDTSWDEFFWGSRFKYNFDSPWNLASEVTFGVENTISAQAYLGYRIPIMNRNLNLRVGYRYFEQDYKSNHFQWDIQQHGPVIGMNLPIF